MQGPCAGFFYGFFLESRGEDVFVCEMILKTSKDHTKANKLKGYGTREHKLRVLVVRSYSTKVTNKRRD